MPKRMCAADIGQAGRECTPIINPDVTLMSRGKCEIHAKPVRIDRIKTLVI
jgi:hypothetical protein